MPTMPATTGLHFASARAFRTWLRTHHATATELLVRFRRRATAAPGISWDEAVDQALCFGWVDGVRKTVDGEHYTIRFTPRRPGSVWSEVNVARIARLRAAKQLAPAGLAAFEQRSAKQHTYSYEARTESALDEALAKALAAAPELAAFHRAQAPSYQRKVVHWIMTAKAPATRARRLAQLLAAYARRRRL